MGGLKTGLGIWILCVFFVGCGSAVQAEPLKVVGGANAPAHPWIAAETGQLRYLVDADGNTYLGLWIDPPDDRHARRAPLALSLVIDTSGSMSGDRIENARRAALDVLETLRDGDLVSVIGFESEIHEWVEPTIVSASTRPMLMERVRNLEAAGGTNMYGGLALGEDRLRGTPATHPIRRVVLISDGHANEGPSDPESLGLLASQGTDYGIQVTAIGVGTGYNERILNELAMRSSGRLYHLENPAQMAQILDEELRILGRTVGVDACIEIVPAPGVRILGFETLGGEIRGGRAYVKLGSLAGGQRRAVLLRAAVDTNSLGSRPAATAKLTFREPSGEKRAIEQSIAVGYEVVKEAHVASASQSSNVRGLVASVSAARVEAQAVTQLNEGDNQAAATSLARAADDLVSAAAKAPEGSDQKRKLQRRASELRDSSTRAKKADAPGAARGAALENNASSYGGLSGVE